jgi:hypothetical protein
MRDERARFRCRCGTRRAHHSWDRTIGTQNMRGGNHALETCLDARRGRFFLHKRLHHLSERVRRTLLEPTLGWPAVPVCPPWQLTRPDADAAQAEPSPGTDLKSDPVRHGLAAQAPATGTAQGGREDQDVLRAASIDAIGLATGRWMYASTGRCERRARP